MEPHDLSGLRPRPGTGRLAWTCTVGRRLDFWCESENLLGWNRGRGRRRDAESAGRARRTTRRANLACHRAWPRVAASLEVAPVAAASPIRRAPPPLGRCGPPETTTNLRVGRGGSGAGTRSGRASSRTRSIPCALVPARTTRRGRARRRRRFCTTTHLLWWGLGSLVQPW